MGDVEFPGHPGTPKDAILTHLAKHHESTIEQIGATLAVIPGATLRKRLQELVNSGLVIEETRNGDAVYRLPSLSLDPPDGLADSG